MTRPVWVTPLARTDLVEIGRHIARDSPAAAGRVLDRLEDASELITEHPEIGRMDEAESGRRFLAIGQSVVIYQVRSERVEILRYLHGWRDRRQL